MILQGYGVYYAFQKERNKAAITKEIERRKQKMPYVILGFMATAVAVETVVVLAIR